MDETGIRKELDEFFASAKNPNEVTGWYLALRDWAELRFQDACALKLEEKNWDNTAFDSKAIVECANSRQVNTPQELASKLGLPMKIHEEPVAKKKSRLRRR